MKRFSIALSLFVASLLGPACTDIDTEEDGVVLDEASQDIAAVSGCDVFVDLSQSTGETGGIHGARYRAYSCENINFYISTGGHNWKVKTTWDGEYDLSGCNNNWLRTRLERTSPGYEDFSTITRWAQPVQYWGTLNGQRALLTKCDHPTNVRDLYIAREYKLSVKSWGGAYDYPHDGRDQGFLFEFTRQ